MKSYSTNRTTVTNNNRELKHRHFRFTDVNRKSLFRHRNQCAELTSLTRSHRREKRLFSIRVVPWDNNIIRNSDFRLVFVNQKRPCLSSLMSTARTWIGATALSTGNNWMCWEFFTCLGLYFFNILGLTKSSGWIWNCRVWTILDDDSEISFCWKYFKSGHIGQSNPNLLLSNPHHHNTFVWNRLSASFTCKVEVHRSLIRSILSCLGQPVHWLAPWIPSSVTHGSLWTRVIKPSHGVETWDHGVKNWSSTQQ